MKNTDSRSGFGKFLSDRVFHIGAAFCRAYDNSLCARLSVALRSGFLTLRTKVIGTFALTFGIYSFLVALLVALFTDSSAHPSSLYGGPILALSSIPLLFSKGNVSTVLTESSLGAALCSLLSIRRETLEKGTFTGHSSIAFVLGVLAGGLTLLFPLSSIVFVIFFALITAIIMTVPEAGITFTVIFLFFAPPGLQYAIIGICSASYIFKLIRRKRKLTLSKAQTVIPVFLLSVLGGIFFTGSDSVNHSLLKFPAMLLASLLCICLIRDRGKLLRVLYVMAMSAGALSAVYVLSAAVSSLTPPGILGDPGFLLRTVSALPFFEGTTAPLAFTALCPIYAAFIIKSRSEGYRFTSFLCLLSSVAYLLVTEEMAFALIAAVSTALFLFITGSRYVYITICAALSGSVVLLFSGSFGNRLYGYIARHVAEAYNQAKDLSYAAGSSSVSGYSFCGQGFGESLSETGSFYYALVYHLGIVGFVILCMLLFFILSDSTVTVIRSYRSRLCDEALQRFSAIGTPAEMRSCIIALSCSVIACIACGTFINYFNNESSFLLFFLLCGLCSAYTGCAKNDFGVAEGSVGCIQSADRSSVTL